MLNHLFILGIAEERVKGGDDSQDVPGQDYQVLRSFGVKEFHGRFFKNSISTNDKPSQLNKAFVMRGLITVSVYCLMTYDLPRETEPLISDNLAPSEPKPQSTMFRRLFRNIRGENRLGHTMEMFVKIFQNSTSRFSSLQFDKI